MDTRVFFVFLALLSVLAADVAAEWPLLNTTFLRWYNRANNSYIDFSLENARDIVPLLDRSQNTAIYIHGYQENVDLDTVKIVTEALLNSTSDNVMSLDYRQISVLPYVIPAEYVPQIGAALAAAINDMVQAGLDGAAVHLIGFTLGAQISGYTGRNTVEKIRRITGLDPAGPLFLTGYLTKGDASFVCIIHTDMFGYGIGFITGDVDFKPNFGRRLQPGCVDVALGTFRAPDICSHFRAWAFFVESVLNPNAFPSVNCNTDFDFMNGTCDTSSIIPMGYNTPNTASGVYYCQTNSKSPYSLGQPGTVYNYTII